MLRSRTHIHRHIHAHTKTNRRFQLEMNKYLHVVVYTIHQWIFSVEIQQHNPNGGGEVAIDQIYKQTHKVTVTEYIYIIYILHKTQIYIH